MSVLHLLFVFEVLWFSDAIVPFLLGGAAWAVWLITIVYLTRVRGNMALNVMRTLLAIPAYPLWLMLLQRRILASQFKGKRSLDV